MTQRREPSESPFQILAPLFGWILPGLGHWVLGYRRRGMYVGGGILFLYLVGIFIGGIGVINRQEYRLWFFGQVLAGPMTPAINWWVTSHPAPVDPEFATGELYATPSFSRINEIGILFTTVAGMLNLVAILDVLAGVPAEKENRERHREGEGARRRASYARRKEDREQRSGGASA